MARKVAAEGAIVRVLDLYSNVAHCSASHLLEVTEEHWRMILDVKVIMADGGMVLV